MNALDVLKGKKVLCVVNFKLTSNNVLTSGPMSFHTINVGESLADAEKI